MAACRRCIPNRAVDFVKTEQVMQLLQAGYAVPQVARKTGTSQVFVATILQHLQRVGQTAAAASLCASGLGACHTPTDLLDVQARIACAGCPLGIRKK